MPYTIFVTARTLSPEGLAILDKEGCTTLFLKGDGSPAEEWADGKMPVFAKGFYP